jgi:transcriptional regulator with XRE-family HTH domain|nr:MAG TPA: bifunctional HTH-domain containing protein/aminotransferase [Caudoviricetes sp.]
MSERNLKQVDILRLAAPYCKKNNIKLNRNDLSQYVNGKVEPRKSKLYILGQALKVNEAWLMGYDVPQSEIDTANSLTEQEKTLLAFYRSASEERKQEIIKFVKQKTNGSD